MDIEGFRSEVFESMSQLFGEGKNEDNIYRIVTDPFGISEGSAIIECVFENGLRADAPYPVIHFHVTLTDHVPARVVPYLRTGLDELNNAIAVGAFPALGFFGFYEPFGQVYLTYRLPYSMDALEEELYNVKYFLGSLYEELDVFMDYIYFLMSNPDGMTLQDYMKHIHGMADFGTEEEIEELRILSKEIHEEAEKLNSQIVR
ncbi:MAG: hypothetical protein K6G84_07210 [Lachnospiraceae bacterium]|nr:hypothetical protein [Lachnospiraceae bacterium]